MERIPRKPGYVSLTANDGTLHHLALGHILHERYGSRTVQGDHGPIEVPSCRLTVGQGWSGIEIVEIAGPEVDRLQAALTAYRQGSTPEVA